MQSIIEDLEEQVEHWRQRAEAAEALLRGAAWDFSVRPLSLARTRMMRLLANRPLTALQLAQALSLDYPNITPRVVYVYAHSVRALLPEAIAPAPACYGQPYQIPDIDALRAFLAGTQQRAAA